MQFRYGALATAFSYPSNGTLGGITELSNPSGLILSLFEPSAAIRHSVLSENRYLESLYLSP